MNPFIEIFWYIKTELKNKYPALAECYMYTDREDDRYKEYYVKYMGELSFKEMDNLYRNIITDVCQFCNKNGYKDALKHSIILIDRLI